MLEMSQQNSNHCHFYVSRIPETWKFRQERGQTGFVRASVTNAVVSLVTNTSFSVHEHGFSFLSFILSPLSFRETYPLSLILHPFVSIGTRHTNAVPSLTES